MALQGLRTHEINRISLLFHPGKLSHVFGGGKTGDICLAGGRGFQKQKHCNDFPEMGNCSFPPLRHLSREAKMKLLHFLQREGPECSGKAKTSKLFQDCGGSRPIAIELK